MDKLPLITGLSIDGIAKHLDLKYKAVSMRLLRGKHEPIFKGNLYSVESFNEIKNSFGKGRPKKQEVNKK